MKKKRITVVVSCIAALGLTLLGAYLFASSGNEDTKPQKNPSLNESNSSITNNEFKETGDTFLFVKGETYYNEILELSEDIDETYNLYLQSLMPKDEMVNQITVLQLQLFEMQKKYDTELYDANIDRANTSLSAKYAFKNLSSLYKELNQLFVNSFDADGNLLSQEEMALVYVVYGENIEMYATNFNSYYNSIVEAISNLINN